MNWNSLRPWLGSAARLCLGIVWLISGLDKIGNPRRFVETIRAYDATPEWLSKAIGYGLPTLEIALGVLLIVGITVRLSAGVSAFLMLMFIVGVLQASARGIKLSCGCFGGGGLTSGSTHYTLDVLRDVGLLILAVFLVLWPMTMGSIEQWQSRHDYVEPPSAKRLRTPEGARKYQAMVESRRKQARDRALYVNSSLGIVVALICVISIGVQAGRAKVAITTNPTNATVANGVVWGEKAAATVDVFEDFQCPHCLDFEQSTRTVLEADVRANKAQVRYHTMAFLDSASNGNNYSTRAANAALCISDVSTDDFVAFHDILFSTAVQPKEGSNGRTNADFATYAQQAGLKPASPQLSTFNSCVTGQTYKPVVEAITENASKRGVNATPTVMVNGKTLANPTLQSLEDAIAAADAKGPAPTPSKTPSPTPTSASPSTSATKPKSTPSPSGT